MLDLLGRHSLIDLDVTAEGDLHVDQHHTVEDVGIVLGQAIEKALGDKRGIHRYGSATVPMDETLASVTVDLSGRPAFVFNVKFTGGAIGTFDVELVEEFLKALATSARMNLHVNVPYGTNNHHIAEAIFKALARGAAAGGGGRPPPGRRRAEHEGVAEWVRRRRERSRMPTHPQRRQARVPPTRTCSTSSPHATSSAPAATTTSATCGPTAAPSAASSSSLASASRRHGWRRSSPGSWGSPPGSASAG
jgi:imidazoleglycerol phosphate dehydratase HisB